ncbi:MAG: DEAD/DEAH box helicase [Candidatus Nanopelagicales bacterium]
MTHPLVPYDQGLIDEIASRMDLRKPNKEALEAVAKVFDGAAGLPFEAVCDLATAVGKTYLAGALIDYLAASGIRHFLIVTPGRTILTKTKNNFTAGHAKSILDGMEVTPTVITSETFATGDTAAALDDDNTSKLFVFTVQSLIKPKDKTNRKVRSFQEWLGDDLYAYLKSVDDLVVISDEHHVYSENAEAFSSAIRDLDAMALVGLTATPDKADEPKIVYHYPLARAIAEKYVKTPVLVGRKDTRTDVEIRLRDGMELLRAKTAAMEAYTQAEGKPVVNPVMFVVCGTITDADEVARVLRKPGLFPDDYDQRVLVIHSEAPDDALARLETVEDPASPVRVIVSVAMLREGWDVKNIFVICSLRPSISDVLTEQTLGRGLRLPWGEYTDVELLDTVEVLSHERYEVLLKRAGVLLEGLVETRSATPAPGDGPATKTTDDTVTTPTAATIDTATAGDDGSDPKAVADDVAAFTDVPGSEAVLAVADAASEAASGSVVEAVTTVLVEAAEDRVEDAKKQAAQLTVQIAPRDDLTINIPKVTKTLTARNFTLSSVSEDAFKALGKRFADETETQLDRKVLDVVEDPSAPGGLRLVPREAGQIIKASAPELPLGGVAPMLRDTILSRDYVTQDKASVGAAKRLADAVVEGAGGEDKLASHLNAVMSAVAFTLNGQYKAAPPVYEASVTDERFAPTRSNARPEEPNRFGPFNRKVAYVGWTKCLHALNWFDSAPERDLANILDTDADVESWARIQRGELAIVTDSAGTYSPDFYARATDGTNYLLEVKADKDVTTDVVQAKKKAAEDWARYVTDNGDLGTWKYVLVPESVMKTAKTFQAVLHQAQA